MAMAFLKYSHAVKKGHHQAAESFDRIVRGHLKNLKATKIDRESSTPQKPKTTPAEWAADLLERCRAEKEEEKRKKKARENDLLTL